MMAKMFYTLDEAKAALGRNEEEIKQYAREGRLREFRDGPRLMFKADQVEALKSELASGGGGGAETIDLIGSDTGAPIGLADSKNASAGGSSISLVDTDAGSAPGLGGSVGGGSVGGSTRGPGSSGSAIALAGSSGAGSGMPLKEDTALAADLGLSGSMGGVPSPGRPGSGLSLGGTGHGTRSGINVFQADEVEHADPSAQTNISSGYPDQVTLDAVGSGSGLLDLTRESDDTSLGAELLDEIAPSGSGSGRTRSGTPAGAVVVAEDSDVAAPVITTGGPTRRTIGQPVYVEQADPMAPLFGGLALGAVLFILFASISLIAGVLGTKNPLGNLLSNQQGQPFGLLILFGIGAGAAIIFAIGGFLVGKSSR